MSEKDFLNVLKFDYCVGCGTCAGCNDEIKMEFDKNGQYKPKFKRKLSKLEVKDASAVCPFTNYGPNEDQISNKLFNQNQSKYDPNIGYFLKIFTGKVISKKIYSKSSSGGIIRWLLSELLSQNIVTKVIHVKSSDTGEPLFFFEEVDEVDKVLNGSNSAYYPVEWSSFIKNIKYSQNKYAVVGVPCFIKSLRKYMDYYEIPNSKVITIGLICGHLKSKFYAYMLAQQLGVEIDSINQINFRKKIPGAKANEKGVEVTYKKNSLFKKKSNIVQNLFGTDYGFGLFKLKACDFCDDVFAETADIVVGDAWLSRYLSEGRSLIVTRSEVFNSILMNAVALNKIDLKRLSLSDAIKSQAGGIKHRKKAISYRLFIEILKGKWVPQKRVKVSFFNLSLREKIIQHLRIIGREKSVKYFKKFLKHKKFKLFENRMKFFYRIYLSFYGSLILIPIKIIFAFLNIDFGLLSRRIKKKK